MTAERPVPPWFYSQAGVVPVRQHGGVVEVLLITSRRGRWIFPKGVIDPGRTDRDAAIAEAWEEAGVRGDLLPGVTGVYRYDKWGGTCTVTVFAMHVREVLDDWPESAVRRRAWMSPADAEAAVPRRQRPMVRAACAMLAAGDG